MNSYFVSFFFWFCVFPFFFIRVEKDTAVYLDLWSSIINNGKLLRWYYNIYNWRLFIGSRQKWYAQRCLNLYLQRFVTFDDQPMQMSNSFITLYKLESERSSNGKKIPNEHSNTNHHDNWNRKRRRRRPQQRLCILNEKKLVQIQICSLIQCYYCQC